MEERKEGGEKLIIVRQKREGPCVANRNVYEMPNLLRNPN